MYPYCSYRCLVQAFDEEIEKIFGWENGGGPFDALVTPLQISMKSPG